MAFNRIAFDYLARDGRTTWTAWDGRTFITEAPLEIFTAYLKERKPVMAMRHKGLVGYFSVEDNTTGIPLSV